MNAPILPADSVAASATESEDHTPLELAKPNLDIQDEEEVWDEDNLPPVFHPPVAGSIMATFQFCGKRKALIPPDEPDFV